MATDIINGLKLGTRVWIKAEVDGCSTGVIAGPHSEAWCVRLDNGRLYNGDVNDVRVDRKDEHATINFNTLPF